MIIKDHENYEIREDGTIWSNHTNSLIQPFLDTRGYFRVTLYNKGKGSTVLLHRLIAIAFLPTTSFTLTVNHKDGNKTNNNLANLEWMSLSDNVKHAYSEGLNCSKGSRNNNAKLTDLYVRAILDSHLSNRELAFLFDIHISTVGKIRKGKLWKTPVGK